MSSASQEEAERSAGFGEQLRGWQVAVLSQTPAQLQAVKLDCCCELRRLLQRLPQLARAQQAGWRLLSDQPARARLLSSWHAVDLYEVVQLTLGAAHHADFYCVTNAASEFEGLLQSDSGPGAFLSFVDRLVARLLGREGGGAADTGGAQSVEHCARWALLAWDTFCREVLRRMPQNGAAGGLYHWLTEYLQYRLQLICTRRAATGRLSELCSTEYNAGGSGSSDNSCAGSDDSGVQRSPPTGQPSPEYPGPQRGAQQTPGDGFPAGAGHPADWPKHEHTDTYCAESG
ncbi:uncharacterized protein LOC122386827 [Amphibalanus amphitrite]|uniref:uncharacterized protein LOC122386827 n=1 Tax=Amphibalanus amphitrite TaxID=1232801 RepID=UPI001C919061|nr:uncharacterized protein LOC122386827 [Amphibalanus amphitrite]